MITSRLAACLLLLAPTVARGQDASIEDPPFRVEAGTFVAIITRDVDAQADWYRRAFGLRDANHITAEDGRYDIRILAGRGLILELLQLRGTAEPPERAFGLFKTGMTVSDIDAAHRWFRQIDADADARVFTDSALAMRSFLLRDPEGNRLQFFQPVAP